MSMQTIKIMENIVALILEGLINLYGVIRYQIYTDYKKNK